MNTFADFLKSRWGLGGLAAVAVLIGISALRGSRSSHAAHGIPQLRYSNTVDQASRNVGAIPPPKRIPAAWSAPVPDTNDSKGSTITVIDFAPPPDTNALPTLFAPAGRLLCCVLVNTIESIRIQTPVIGVVTRDLWYNGQVIVPTNTEVFGTAEVDRVRDRLSAGRSWVLVFPNGDELTVSGLALHREEIVAGQHWGANDGSAGFKGQVIHSASWDELKYFASAFLSAASRSAQQAEYTVYGTQLRQSVPNAALAGSSAVLDEYARSIAETIKRDGTYVRVVGGALFYLYLDKTLNRSAAHRGATRSALASP